MELLKNIAVFTNKALLMLFWLITSSLLFVSVGVVALFGIVIYWMDLAIISINEKLGKST